MDDLFADFLAETRVELDRAQDALARLEQGAAPEEALAEIRRGVEAIRARCAEIGFVRIAALGEGAKASLERLRGAQAISPTDVRTLRRAVDRMARLIATLAATGAEPVFDASETAPEPAPEPANDHLATQTPAQDAAWSAVEAAFTTAAGQMGKHAVLVIEPSARALADPIVAVATAPLQRIVRYLCVYSIEPDLVRNARGKHGSGSVRIAALSVGAEAVLAISDDGAGIDLARLRRRATAMKLIAEGESLSDTAAAALIFAPNLSTLSEGDNESGLDRAKAMAEAAGGALEVSTVEGRGATFLLRLPTHAIQGAA